MEIEQEHIEMFEILLNEDGLTTYELAKKLFPKLNSNGWSKKKNNVKYWIKEFIKEDLIKEERKDRTNFYSVVKKNVEISKSSTLSTKKRNINLGKVCLVRRNSIWNVITFN